jgi:hypothetical protein
MATKTTKKTGVAAARARISSAKKALAKGEKGASARLDKAITAYAKSACKLKTTKGSKRKQVTATIGKKKKKSPAKRKTTSRTK